MHLRLYQKFIGTVYTLDGLDQKLEDVISLLHSDLSDVLFFISLHVALVSGVRSFCHFYFPYISLSSLEIDNGFWMIPRVFSDLTGFASSGVEICGRAGCGI